MKKILMFFALCSVFMLFSVDCKAQLTINIRYTAENGNLQKYV